LAPCRQHTNRKIQHHSIYITHHMKVKRIGLIRYSPQHFMTDWPDSVSWRWD
jgi:hypothetical protein